MNLYGSLALSQYMNPNSFLTSVTFLSTSPGNTIKTGGIRLDGVSFSGAGGEWTFLDDFSSTYIYHSNGNLNTNNKAVKLTNHFNSSAREVARFRWDLQSSK